MKILPLYYRVLRWLLMRTQEHSVQTTQPAHWEPLGSTSHGGQHCELNSIFNNLLVHKLLLMTYVSNNFMLTCSIFRPVHTQKCDHKLWEAFVDPLGNKVKPQKTSAFSRQCITRIANLIYTCFI